MNRPIGCKGRVVRSTNTIGEIQIEAITNDLAPHTRRIKARLWGNSSSLRKGAPEKAACTETSPKKERPEVSESSAEKKGPAPEAPACLVRPTGPCHVLQNCLCGNATTPIRVRSRGCRGNSAFWRLTTRTK